MNSRRSHSLKADTPATEFQRRFLNGVLISSLIFIGSLLILSLAGVSDPRPVGEQIWVDEFASGDRWTTQNTTPQNESPLTYGELSLEANTLILIRSPYRVQTPGSLILICTQVSGAPDAGFGLWIATDNRLPLVVGINMDAYLGIFEPLPSAAEATRPWRIFPHVKKLGEPNKFQLDLNDDVLTIWLNDERVTQIGYAAASLNVGLYAETFDENAVFRFERLEGWQK